eukprot:scaffold31950_cov112-Isochrysis_galbana.AAC.1
MKEPNGRLAEQRTKGMATMLRERTRRQWRRTDKRRGFESGAAHEPMREALATNAVTQSHVTRGYSLTPSRAQVLTGCQRAFATCRRPRAMLKVKRERSLSRVPMHTGLLKLVPVASPVENSAKFGTLSLRATIQMAHPAQSQKR